jgi:hypothetical protein
MLLIEGKMNISWYRILHMLMAGTFIGDGKSFDGHLLFDCTMDHERTTDILVCRANRYGQESSGFEVF